MTYDPLRAPETDDEPWAVPVRDSGIPTCDRYWYAFLAVVVLGLVAVALVRWR